MMSQKFRIVLCICILFVIPSFPFTIAAKPCFPVDFGYGSIVCRCNSTYCDESEPFESVYDGYGIFYAISSKSGQRFQTFKRNKVKLNPSLALQRSSTKSFAEIKLVIDRSVKFQSISGFGGAFTDSTGINMASATPGLQKKVSEIPMGGSDFSTRKYSYDDVDFDTDLKHFTLAEEDLIYKIPFIKEAVALRPNIKLLAAPWSAPKWMKTNGEFTGQGYLNRTYYQVWANYFSRFLEEYRKHNITFWGVTAQNEPIDGQIPSFAFNCMGWTAEEQRDWIKNNLGPTLKQNGFADVKIIIFDDQRAFLNPWIRTVLRDPDAAKYISGIGVHWYFDIFPPSILDTANREFPDYFLLGTEACIGSLGGEHEVLLGSWERAENYAEDIMEDLNHWVTGWIDWNLVLDLNGGPNWSNNFVDAPIILDNVTNVFYKQPMYYAIGHFSKYIPENSVRILSSSSQMLRGFETLTVLRPDGLLTTVVLNKLEEFVHLRIVQPESDLVVEMNVGPRSIHSIVY